MGISITELALLVLAGLASGTYAKSEGANSVLAAVIGAAVAVVIYLIVRS